MLALVKATIISMCLGYNNMFPREQMQPLSEGLGMVAASPKPQP
jgi:hypothetical protein